MANDWRMDYNHYRPSSLGQLRPLGFVAICPGFDSAILRQSQNKDKACNTLIETGTQSAGRLDGVNALNDRERAFTKG